MVVLKKTLCTGIFILHQKKKNHHCSSWLHSLLHTYGGLLVQMFVRKEIMDQIEVDLLKTIKLFS